MTGPANRSPEPSAHPWLQAALAPAAPPIAAPDAEPVPVGVTQPMAARATTSPEPHRLAVPAAITVPTATLPPPPVRAAVAPAPPAREVPLPVTPEAQVPARRAEVTVEVPVAVPSDVAVASDERVEPDVDEPSVWTPSGTRSSWGSSRGAPAAAPLRRVSGALPAALTTAQQNPRVIAAAARRKPTAWVVASAIAAVVVALLAAFALGRYVPSAGPSTPSRHAALTPAVGQAPGTGWETGPGDGAGGGPRYP